jgi:type II secretory pathway pseudopilin PulG
VKPRQASSVRAPGAGSGAGFTVVELMGVLIVLGLIATLTFASWEAILPRTTLNTAVRELAATLSEARSDAIARNAHFSIEYNFEEAEDRPVGYRVITPFRKGPQGGFAAFDEERLALKWHPLPDTVRFHKILLNGKDYNSGAVVVGFTPLGAASDHTVVLKQLPYDYKYTIEVLALTGLIRFHEDEFVREFPRDAEFQ